MNVGADLLDSICPVLSNKDEMLKRIYKKEMNSELNKRLYSSAEILSHFGEREYFKNMHAAELCHVVGYIARKLDME